MTIELPDDIVQAVGPILPGDVLILRASSNVQSRTHFDALVDELTPVIKAVLPDVKLCFLAGIDEILHGRPAEPDPEPTS